MKQVRITSLNTLIHFVLQDMKLITVLLIDTSAPLPGKRMQEAWENEIWEKSLLTELGFPNADWLIDW